MSGWKFAKDRIEDDCERKFLEQVSILNLAPAGGDMN
jgi:hypothetical protein